MTTIEIHNKLITLETYLMRYALKLTENRDDARDLLQDTYLRVYEYSDKFENGSNFKAWTYTIMKNSFINKYRRLKYFKLKMYDITTRERNISISSNHSDASIPQSIYEVKELMQAIESLNDNLKKPLKMHIEGFKYVEIANTLDMKLGTVKSRIFIARLKLKKQLNDYAG